MALAGLTTNFASGAVKRLKSGSPEWEAWKTTPSPEAYGELMKTVQPTVDSALRSLGGDKQSALDIRARILADKAVKTYDPKQGASLKTHLYNSLQPLQRIAQQRRYATSVPEGVIDDRQQYTDFSRRYNDEHGHEPSMAETMQTLGWSQSRFGKIRATREAGEGEFESEKGDTSVVSNRRHPNEVWTDAVYHDLDEKSKKVFEWASGYGGGQTLPTTEIARRLKITPAAVSGRIATIQKQLEEGYGTGQ